MSKCCWGTRDSCGLTSRADVRCLQSRARFVAFSSPFPHSLLSLIKALILHMPSLLRTESEQGWHRPSAVRCAHLQAMLLRAHKLVQRIFHMAQIHRGGWPQKSVALVHSGGYERSQKSGSSSSGPSPPSSSAGSLCNLFFISRAKNGKPTSKSGSSLPGTLKVASYVGSASKVARTEAPA